LGLLALPTEPEQIGCCIALGKLLPKDISENTAPMSIGPSIGKRRLIHLNNCFFILPYLNVAESAGNFEDYFSGIFYVFCCF